MFAPNPYLTPWLGAASVLLAYAGLCVGVARTHARRQASAQNIPGGRASTHTPTGHAPAGTLQAVVHVVYASQTGHAESLARHSALALQAAGRITQVLPLNQLTPATLQGLRSGGELLLVVSTQGEGDAPDNAQNFVRRYMQTSIDLSGLRYSVLALADGWMPGYKHVAPRPCGTAWRCIRQTLRRLHIGSQHWDALPPVPPSLRRLTCQCPGRHKPNLHPGNSCANSA